MWLNPQKTVHLVTFTKETLNEKFHLLCSGMNTNWLNLVSDQILDLLSIIVIKIDRLDYQITREVNLTFCGLPTGHILMSRPNLLLFRKDSVSEKL